MSVGIIVTGSPRTGTTMLMGILEMLGVELMIPDGADRKYLENPRIAVLAANIAVDMSGMSLMGTERLPRGWKIPRTEMYLNQLNDEFDELDKHPLWGLKNVMLCRALPVFEDALKDRDIRYIITRRNRRDSIESINKHWKLCDGYRAAAIHDNYVEYAAKLADSTDRPLVHVEYEDLRRHWHPVIDYIGHALNIEWPRNPDLISDWVPRWIH